VLIEIKMPKFGQTMEEGKIVRWLKKENDFINKGEVFLEIESDKSVLEVESEYEGRLINILEPEEKVVPYGDVIATMDVNM